jgi:1,4-dihydroxy-2-naphthoate octaprenyltransferase
METSNGHISESNGVKIEAKEMNIYQRKLASYIIALRPWSFSASMTPVALGCALCYKMTSHFDPFVVVLTCVAVVAVHAAGNLVNTYYDYIKGVDSCKVSDDRTLVDQVLTPQEVVRLGVLSYLIGCIGLCGLVFMSSASLEQLSLLFFGGLSASFLYTGGFALKYYALGDLVIVVTFGPLAVLFAFVAQCGSFSWMPLLYATPLVLNTEAILHSNNTRDMKQDQLNGIVTLAILLGQRGSYILFMFLLFTPYVLFAVLAVNYNIAFLLPLVTLRVAFDLDRRFRERNIDSLPQKTAVLNLYLGLMYVISVLLAVH